MYGGDITRKMKLREKQKKGQEKDARAYSSKVDIPHDVFLKVVSDLPMPSQHDASLPRSQREALWNRVFLKVVRGS